MHAFDCACMWSHEQKYTFVWLVLILMLFLVQQIQILNRNLIFVDSVDLVTVFLFENHGMRKTCVRFVFVKFQTNGYTGFTFVVFDGKGGTFEVATSALNRDWSVAYFEFERKKKYLHFAWYRTHCAVDIHRKQYS